MYYYVLVENNHIKSSFSYITPYSYRISHIAVLLGDIRMKQIKIKYSLFKKAIRIITHSPFQCHSSPLFRKTNNLNIFQIIEYYASIFMFQKLQSLTYSNKIDSCLILTTHMKPVIIFQSELLYLSYSSKKNQYLTMALKYGTTSLLK